MSNTCSEEVANVLITGNGFDLHHCLPTRYCDFLDVMNRLLELDTAGKLQNCLYLAYVFGEQSPLYNSNSMIKKCYDTHRNVIDCTPLDSENIEKMVNGVKRNTWMKYFMENHFASSGWIDFEKEVAEVIGVFRCMIVRLNSKLEENGEPAYVEEIDVSRGDYIVLMQNAFQKFFDEVSGWHALRTEYYNTKGFANEKIYCSVNEKKIAMKLYQDLEDLIGILDWYITEFIQKIAVNTQSRNQLFAKCQRVINFNYTNTFSALYDKQNERDIFYVHGSAQDNNMVLGINDDETDQLGSLNLSFVEFKKYYQRTFKHTDYDYDKILPNGGGYRLHFVGHSMDITDQDILKLLITDKKTSGSIIYYHDEASHRQLIMNVIALFGKDKFEQLKREHKITFKQLDPFEG